MNEVRGRGRGSDTEIERETDREGEIERKRKRKTVKKQNGMLGMSQSVFLKYLNLFMGQYYKAFISVLIFLQEEGKIY